MTILVRSPDIYFRRGIPRYAVMLLRNAIAISAHALTRYGYSAEFFNAGESGYVLPVVHDGREFDIVTKQATDQEHGSHHIWSCIDIDDTSIYYYISFTLNIVIEQPCTSRAVIFRVDQGRLVNG